MPPRPPARESRRLQPRRHSPAAAAALAAAALIAAVLIPAAGGAPLAHPGEHAWWKPLSRGLEFRVMDGGEVCRKGPRDIAVLRARPQQWKLGLHHYAEDPNARGGFIVEEWQRRTGAAVVFNAGQYYPDRTPMGLFVKSGRNLGTKRIAAWKGILAAEPDGGRLPRIAIVDLEHESFDVESTPYRVAMQTFMVLDRRGRKRVRRSDWHANRTLVATDTDGRLLVLCTEGAYTLWELADWLSRSDLRVRHAVSMDGGFEAQLAVRAGEFSYLNYGRYHVDDRGDHSLPGYKAPLPAVVELTAR